MAPKAPTFQRCGFCSTAAHHYCPSGVRNGDGHITICNCGCEQSQQMRCTTCNNRRPEELTDWKCTDPDACAAEVQRRLQDSPVFQRVLAAQQAAKLRQATTTPTRAPSRSETPPKAQENPGLGCWCACGGTTKGGKFLPGHDSKYLNILLEVPSDEAQAKAYKVSPAFGAKFDKRRSKTK